MRGVLKTGDIHLDLDSHASKSLIASSCKFGSTWE